jgi:hypothetical protein
MNRQSVNQAQAEFLELKEFILPFFLSGLSNFWAILSREFGVSLKGAGLLTFRAGRHCYILQEPIFECRQHF